MLYPLSYEGDVSILLGLRHVVPLTPRSCAYC